MLSLVAYVTKYLIWLIHKMARLNSLRLGPLPNGSSEAAAATLSFPLIRPRRWIERIPKSVILARGAARSSHRLWRRRKGDERRREGASKTKRIIS